MPVPAPTADARCSRHAVPRAANASLFNRSATSFPFPAAFRLKQGWEYDTLFRTGSRLKGRLVRLLFVQAPDGKTRCAMAVGKKMGKAVRRNRGRRVLREAVRRLYPWLKDGWWFALMLTERGMNATAPEVYADLGRVLSKEGFLSDDWPGAVWYQ